MWIELFKKQNFILLLVIPLVVAEISLKQVVKVCNERRISLLNRKSCFFGKLYYVTGVMSNVRFFHSEVEKNWKLLKKGTVFLDYVKDTTPEKIISAEGAKQAYPRWSNETIALLIQLFPSPSGAINPFASKDLNFATIIYNNLLTNHDGIRFLAFILYYNSLCETKKKEFPIVIKPFTNLERSKFICLQVNCGDEHFQFVLDNSKNIENMNAVFGILVALFNENYTETNDILQSKNLIIQAFIVQLLNNEKEFENFIGREIQICR